MPERHTCSECHTPLPGDAPEGFCPACSLEGALRFGGVFSEAGVNRFGDYELIEEIARGGMGVVYRARQVSLDRIVAVKLILFGQFANEAVVKRFRAEATSAARLQHPRIVALHEVGEQNGHQFFSMDYVAGRNLAELLRDGPLPAKRAASLLRTIVEAIHYAHGQGIVHRDLKPSNILIDELGEPHITDFGLAKNLKTDSDLTLSGQIIGSPNFIAPEQAAGKTESVGPHSDVYSLGAILYQMLTGRTPFGGETITETLNHVLHSDPPAPRLLNPSVPHDLETICLKCLEKEPHQRYPTAQFLAQELGRFLRDEPITASPITGVERAWRWCRRKPALATAYSLLLLFFLVILIGSPFAAYRINQARQAEVAQRQRAERHVYAHEVNLANEALRDFNLVSARELLDRQRPRAGKTNDLRGFEWRYVYDQCRNQEQSTLGPFGAAVTVARFTPSGDHLAIADSDGNAWLWDWRTRKEIRAFPARANFRDYFHASERRSLAISPDGRKLVVGAGNNIALVDLNSDRSAELRGHTDGVRYLEFSPDGRTLASGSADGTTRLWDFSVDPPISVGVLNVGFGVSCAAFSADSGLLALAGNEFDIKLWDVSNARSPQELPALKGHITAVLGLAFSPRGRVLAAAGAEIILWSLDASGEVTSERRLVRGRGGLGVIEFVTFSRDGQTLISAGSDRNITLWDLSEQREPVRWMGHEGEIYFVAESPEGGVWASASYDRSVKLWDLSAPWPRAPSMSYSNFVMAVAFSPDSKLLASVAYRSETEMKLWDVASTNLVAERDAIPGKGGNRLAFSSNGQVIAADGGGKVRLLEVPSLTEITNVPGWQPAFSPTGEELIYDHKGVIRRRNLKTNAEQVLSTGWGPISMIVPLPHNRGVAAAGGENSMQVRLWRTEAPDRPVELGRHLEKVYSLAASPDGRWLASASWDGTSRIWDLDSLHEPPRILASHKGAVWAVAFSPDGRTLATGGDDYTIKLWNVASWQEAATLRGHTHLVSSLSFSGDGRSLASCSGDGTVRLWHAPTLEEIATREKENK